MTDPNLKSIVQKMIDAGEPEENIATVIRNYRPSSSPEVDTTGMAAPIRFAAGAARVLNPVPFAKSLKTDPVGTAQQMWSAQTSQFDKAAAAPTVSEKIGYGAAGLLPILGPAAAHAGETIAGGDVAGGLGEAAGILAPMKTAREAITKPAGLALRALPESVAAAADQAANARFVDVAAPKVGSRKVEFGNMAEKVAPQILRQPDMGAFSREGLSAKIDAAFEDAGVKLDEAAAARGNTKAYPTAPVIAALERQKARLAAQPVEASRVVPSVTGDAVTSQAVDPMREYALRWMKQDMEAQPFTKKTILDTVRKGSDKEVVSGAAGAPIYRAIVGPEGRELISASRAQVIQAIQDEIDGKPIREGGGRLRELVRGVADKLGNGGVETAQRLGMITSDLTEPFNPVLSRTVDMSGQPAEMPAKQGRPMGEPVVPGPNQGEADVIDRAIAEVKQLGPVARYESLRRIREAYDKPASARYNAATTPNYEASQAGKIGAMKVTGALRESLAGMDPQTAEANAQYSLYKTAKDVLDATAERERVRPRVGRGIVARASGAMIGAQEGGVIGAGVGAIAAQAVDKLADAAPTTKLYTARLLAQLADAIRGERPTEVAKVQSRLRKVIQAAAPLPGVASGLIQALPKVAEQPQETDRTAQRD